MKRFFSLKKAVIFLSIILAAVSVLLVKTTTAFNKNKQALAEVNSSHWASLAQIANDAKSHIVSVEDIKDYKRILYNNAVIYNVSDLLLPGFNEKKLGFLRITYDALLQQLANDDMPQEKRQKGLELFMDMNDDLVSICEKAAARGDDKAALIDSSSKIYQELQTQIDAFVGKYTEAYDAFSQTK